MQRCERRRERFSHGTHLGEGSVLVLELFSKRLHLLNACREPTAILDFLLFAIEPEPVLLERSVRARGGSGTKMVLVKSDGEGRIGGKDEFRVALATVSVDSQSGGDLAIEERHT